MHEFASFNREILPADIAEINAISSAALYGRGVFTTFPVFDSKPFLWDKHWRRLGVHAQKAGINRANLSEREIFDALEKIIEKNNVSNGRCRLTLFDETPGKIWSADTKTTSGYFIQTADFRRKPRQNPSLAISPFPINSRSPLAGIKSCNYLENILALETAQSEGFDEAVRLNERGEIASACTANIFWLRKEKLFTPSLKTGCLAGTIREFILEKKKVFEVEENLETLSGAEQIFLTSSGIGVVQARAFGGKKITCNPHELTAILPDFFQIT